MKHTNMPETWTTNLSLGGRGKQTLFLTASKYKVSCRLVATLLGAALTLCMTDAVSGAIADKLDFNRNVRPNTHWAFIAPVRPTLPAVR